MVVNRYQVEIDEIAQATLSFLEHRPGLRFILGAMKFVCCFMIVTFVFKCLYHNASFVDLAITLFALAWLFYRKKINRFLLKRSYKAQKLDQVSRQYQISKTKIWWKENNHVPQELRWQQVPYILEHTMGYLIPLTGMQNSGRFLWFPLRGFEQLEEFQRIIKEKEIKLKKLA